MTRRDVLSAESADDFDRMAVEFDRVVGTLPVAFQACAVNGSSPTCSTELCSGLPRVATRLAPGSYGASAVPTSPLLSPLRTAVVRHGVVGRHAPSRLVDRLPAQVTRRAKTVRGAKGRGSTPDRFNRLTDW